MSGAWRVASPSRTAIPGRTGYALSAASGGRRHVWLRLRARVYRPRAADCYHGDDAAEQMSHACRVAFGSVRGYGRSLQPRHFLSSFLRSRFRSCLLLRRYDD